MDNSGSEMLLLLVELCVGIDINVFNMKLNADWTQLYKLGYLHISIVNDLYSFKKEIKHDDIKCNYVLLMMHWRGKIILYIYIPPLTYLLL